MILIKEVQKIQLFEAESSSLTNKEEFFLGHVYEADYEIINDGAFDRDLVLANDSFRFNNNSNRFNVPIGKTKFKITFSPNQLGSNSFLITLLKKAQVRKDVELLNRSLNVIKATQKIDGQVEGLPPSMKLGQKAEILFLFTNAGNQVVNGISIEVKQIEA
jgi:hypothetical protein